MGVLECPRWARYSPLQPMHRTSLCLLRARGVVILHFDVQRRRRRREQGAVKVEALLLPVDSRDGCTSACPCKRRTATRSRWKLSNQRFTSATPSTPFCWTASATVMRGANQNRPAHVCIKRISHAWRRRRHAPARRPLLRSDHTCRSTSRPTLRPQQRTTDLDLPVRSGPPHAADLRQ